MLTTAAWHAIGITANGRWTPGIGDPSWVGWFTVMAYFSTAILCLLCARYARRQFDAVPYKKHYFFWIAVSVILLFLGINKQLDLQSLLTAIGRDISQAEGWYESRRTIQKLFITAISIGSAVAVLLFFKRYRLLWKHNQLACAGLAFLLIFVVGRAASFHYVDDFINSAIVGIKLNWILELGGIFCIAIAALLKLYRRLKHIRLKF